MTRQQVLTELVARERKNSPVASKSVAGDDSILHIENYETKVNDSSGQGHPDHLSVGKFAIKLRDCGKHYKRHSIGHFQY